MSRRLPGFKWRVLGWRRPGQVRGENDGDLADPVEGKVALEFRPRDRVEFDELVVGGWLHIEQMADRDWWAQIGDAYLWIHIAANGHVQVDIRRGEYGPVCGTTETEESA